MKQMQSMLLMVLFALIGSVSFCGAATQQEVWIDTSLSGGLFSSGTVKLHGYLYLPDSEGNKKYPLLIINHGTPVTKNAVATYHHEYKKQATYFSDMGFVVVAFARRGYGGSGGNVADTTLHWKCGSKEDRYKFDTPEIEIARDNKEVIDWASNLPNVDISKGVVITGQSAGGFGALSAAAKDQRVRAVISFAGGAGSRPGGNICAIDVLLGKFKQFGSAIPYLTLWFYSEDDDFFSPATADGFRKSYIEGGGQVKLVTTKAGNGGHGWFPKNRNVNTWGPVVREYLKSRGFSVRQEN